jgi:hypothetical protein
MATLSYTPELRRLLERELLTRPKLDTTLCECGLAHEDNAQFIGCAEHHDTALTLVYMKTYGHLIVFCRSCNMPVCAIQVARHADLGQ